MSARVYNFIGSGGKTSTILYLMEEYQKQGKRVVITSLTHMHSPRLVIEGTDLLCRTIDEVKECLDRGEIAWYGRPIKDGSCFTMDSLSDWETLLSMADVILCEGDGSRRHPVKVPSEKEPVIFPGTDHICIVSGLSGLGKPIKEVCHRIPLVLSVLSKYREVNEDSLLIAEDFIHLIQDGYLDRMEKEHPECGLLIYLNQVTGPETQAAGYLIREAFASEYPVYLTNHTREVMFGNLYD